MKTEPLHLLGRGDARHPRLAQFPVADGAAERAERAGDCRRRVALERVAMKKAEEYFEIQEEMPNGDLECLAKCGTLKNARLTRMSLLDNARGKLEIVHYKLFYKIVK